MDALHCPICQTHIPPNTGWHFTQLVHSIYSPTADKVYCSSQCAKLALAICELGVTNA